MRRLTFSVPLPGPLLCNGLYLDAPALDLTGVPPITVTGLGRTATDDGQEQYPFTNLTIDNQPCSWGPKFSDGPFYRGDDAKGCADLAGWLLENHPGWTPKQADTVADRLEVVLTALHEDAHYLAAHLAEPVLTLAHEVAALTVTSLLPDTPPTVAARLAELTSPTPPDPAAEAIELRGRQGSA